MYVEVRKRLGIANVYVPSDDFTLDSSNQLQISKDKNNYKLVLSKSVFKWPNSCDQIGLPVESTYQPISEDSKFYYVPIQKAIDCNGLWNNSIFDESGKFKRPPQKIPKWLLDEFKHHSNLIDIKHHYYDELNHNIWNQTFNKWGK